MRQIKFRAWDEKKEIMHHNFQFIRSGVEGNDWIVFTSDEHDLNHKPHPFKDSYFAQQLKIMEYAGLKDKQGKKIYEGDIVKIIGGEPELEVLSVVFLMGAFRDSYYHWNLYGKESCLEVIGNVYENPELIKE